MLVRCLTGCLVALAFSACNDGENGVAGLAAGSTSSTGGSSAQGGTNAGGTSSAGPVACGLPAAGASGVPTPSGVADGLTVLDWAGFKSAVSYTLDDGNASQVTHYATLQELGVHFTFYLVSAWGSAKNAIWQQAFNDGHELGNHTAHHCHDTGCTGGVDAATDTDQCTTFLASTFGLSGVWTMAAPYGDYGYAQIAQSRFLINRGVASGSIAPRDSTNPFNIPCNVPAQAAPASALDAVVDAARSSGKWQCFLVHGFTGDANAYLPIDIEAFTATVARTKSLGDVWIDSVTKVGAYWRAQKLLASLTPSENGGEKSWTWTLPDHFPPGQCLRVKVDGGTLRQGSTPLAWDDHGYYEVALDAGSLTLSP